MAPLICHQKWRNATHETFDINQEECAYLEIETVVICSRKLFYNCIHFPSLASKKYYDTEAPEFMGTMGIVPTKLFYAK